MPNDNEMLRPAEEPEKLKEAPKQELTKLSELTPEQLAQCEAYMQENPEVPAPVEKVESSPDVLEFEALVAPYESEQLIGELMAITTVSEALASPERKMVKDALIPILKKLQEIEKKSDISVDKLTELKLKYKRLSQAVGMLNSGGVDHAR